MSRLPTPGSDDGTWGTILNDFLSVELNTNGTLKRGSDIDTALSTANAAQTSANIKIDKSVVTTKGDLLVATASSTVARLGVGANGQRLVADSAQTTGVKWASDSVLLASDYGAKFDGSTDDASALQNAINAAVSANLPLVLPAGTAIVGTPLSISAPVTIVGVGREASKLKAKAGLNDFVIKFTGGSAGVGIVGAHFSDFTIDGNLGGPQTAGGGISADGAVQCSFERLHITSAYNWGLKLGPITGGGFGHHNRVISCLFDNSGSSTGYGGGIWLTSTDENWIFATDFENLGGSSFPTGTSPIMLYDQSGLQTIDSCCFVGGSNNCIGVRLQNVQRTKVVNSTFDGTAGDSLFLVTNKCLIANNLVTGPGTVGSSPATGIHLEFDTLYNVVVNNVLVCSDTAGKTRSLIREEATGGSGNNLIEGNSLTWGANGPTVALLESAGTNTIVRNNLAWKTEANGTATVGSAATSVAVTHGMDVTPALANIVVTPTNNLGTATKFWISSPTNTQFTINVDAAPGASTATFAWTIRM